MEARARLDSWKDIARYLGRDVRTVIRWEQTRGLPVHRVPGGTLSRVFAYPDELDRWLEGGGAARANGETTNGRENSGAIEPFGENDVSGSGENQVSSRAAPAGSRLRRWFAVPAGVALLAAFAFVWKATRDDGRLPTRLAVVENEVLALNATGQTRWIYRPDGVELGPPEMRWSYVRDLDGDTHPDPIASLEVGRPPFTEHTGELRAFSADGDVRWSLTPDDRLAFRSGEYGPPWPAKDLAVYSTRGQTRIAWTVHHFTWGPSLLITVDATGKRMGTFVNAGWIRMAERAPDERYLIATGTTNSREASFFAVLDADRPAGHSPEPAGSSLECVRCPPGDPLQYVVLPRTDVSRLEHFPTDGPTIMTFADGTTQVHSLESGGPNIAAAIYVVAPDLTIREVRFSDSYWEWHRRLERDGKLDHAPAACPHRQGLEVQRWTRAEGWRSVPVPVR